MCEFCIKHGEGEKWYLNVKNYSQDLVSDITRQAYVKDFFYRTERSYKKYFPLVKALRSKMPIISPLLTSIIRRRSLNTHWGQVVPLEDVAKILSITSSIVRIPCACSKITTGRERRTCFVTTLRPESVGLIDQSFFGGPDVARFERMDKVSALDFMKEKEKEGLFHSIWTLKTPFIGVICNCDNTGCIAMKMHKEVTANFFKAEYIVRLDKAECTGCQACIKICPFDASEYSTADKKAVVNHKKCSGCGICRSVCKKNALTLLDRRSTPEAAGLW